MTRFERIGVEIQYGATSKQKAQGSFRYSCNVCCNRGTRIDCERCAIASTHTLSFSGNFSREMVCNSLASILPKGTPVRLDIKCLVTL